MAAKKRTVFVGLSGGVDSSVAAALLIEQGFHVVGVFIKVWQAPFLPCTWREDRRDAMRVAAHLDIPFITFDLEKEYKKEVVDLMIEEYKRGCVPNPDVVCNKEVKFGAFLEKAQAMGADLVATGHYARLRREFPISNFQFPNKPQKQNLNTAKKNYSLQNTRYRLLRGVDENKDQSYFLWTLTQDRLRYVLFPVGGYTKPEVRRMAKKFGLPTFEKKDSQGLCFIGKVDMKDFLKHYIDEKKGDVLDVNGSAIGCHDGAWFYTIGQRHGFTVIKKSDHELPYYVVSKDIDANTITVAREHIQQGFAGKETSLRDVNWIGGAPEEGGVYQMKVRYRQTPQGCRVFPGRKKTKVVFDSPQNIAPGQSLVLYDQDICLGGGIIA